MYKTSRADCDTRDWISLNFDSVPSDAIVKIFGGDEIDALVRVLSEREDCAECSGEGYTDDPEADWGSDACKACDGTGYTKDDESRELYGWPAAHATLWQCEDRPEIVDALLASGFIVYRPAHTFDGLIVGIDGGGYSFIGAHWIPLRARLAKAQAEQWNEPINPELLQLLGKEALAESETDRLAAALGGE